MLESLKNHSLSLTISFLSLTNHNHLYIEFPIDHIMTYENHCTAVHFCISCNGLWNDSDRVNNQVNKINYQVKYQYKTSSRPGLAGQQVLVLRNHMYYNYSGLSIKKDLKFAHFGRFSNFGGLYNSFPTKMCIELLHLRGLWETSPDIN